VISRRVAPRADARLLAFERLIGFEEVRNLAQLMRKNLCVVVDFVEERLADRHGENLVVLFVAVHHLE
jgi:hypothetical protein